MQRLQHQLLLQLGLVVMDLTAIQRSQHILTLLHTVLRDEVPRRVRQIPHPDDNENAKENLEGNREPPNQVRRTMVRAKVNPVRDHGSNGNDTTLDANEQATVMRLRTFRLIRGDGRGVHTIADARDDSPEEELQKGDVTDERGDLSFIVS